MVAVVLWCAAVYQLWRAFMAAAANDYAAAMFAGFLAFAFYALTTLEITYQYRES